MVSRWGALAVALLLVVGALPAAAQPKEKCGAQPEMLNLAAPLTRTREAMEQRKQVRIVAIGSSSTQGYGATSPFNSYPAELLRVLQRRLNGVDIHIANKGVGGEDVGEMVDRIARDVYPEKPDLVIWQAGTNAAIRGFDLAEFRRRLTKGIDLFQVIGADVVLMTPQYAPAVVSLVNEDQYITAMEEVAKEKGAGIFKRFQIMRHWLDEERMPFAHFLSGDGLHLNDFGYRCIGRIFGRAIERSVRQ
jgi:acyl-CoA thioesterase-1